MRVHPSQLTSGCIITKDVMGRTNRPIVPKNTVVHPIHISVLRDFSIQSVEVATKLNDGQPFIPNHQMEDEEASATTNDTPQELTPFSFQEQYLEAVQSYKRWFANWKAGSPVDIQAVRRVMVPLLEKAVEVKKDVFLLHHYSSSEDYLYHHSVTMGMMSGYLAHQMGSNYGEWIQVGLAGVLSDCGMSQVDEKILHKEGPLSEEEYNQVKKHPTYSYRLVEKIPSLSSGAKLAVLQHHERLNGSGYPLGLRQEKLHPFSQLIAVSDMYHAMTSERLYRKKQAPLKVLEEILQEQFGRYDHKVIQALVKEMIHFSTGSKVRLSNNKTAEVLFVDHTHPTRPMIRLDDNSEIYQLKEHLHLHIEEVID
ncbi:HD-GYP domain-containing protein [Halobacillus sp. BBL2006]|uniref:HD-GYP domain-containing protein n=1 Tax=Halobacillus sp. BBL2006 TaxID=1543706 RepID=UPI00054238BF|nr:HD-GYP domain-containing protein [Halobacillus sp. BBL2006]KHE73185.1 metal-dependent phosphohydrolase [Halobacillus sp. BBL2006]